MESSVDSALHGAIDMLIASAIYNRCVEFHMLRMGFYG